MATQQDDFYDIRKKGPECEPFDRHPWPDRGVPETDDQLPTFSKVGRGIQGDSYRVDVVYDDLDETYLKGFAKDSASGTWSEDWTSENINGGNLTYQFALRRYTIPNTSTIPFDYSRPERGGWTMTTPAIPYVGDADQGILLGVSTLFLREKSSSSWPSSIADSQTSHTINQSRTRLEKLLYPNNKVRSEFNAPVPGDPWTVNLQYGIGGDINCPSLTDLAKILGVTPGSIEDLADDPVVPTDTFGGMNVKEYIDNHIGGVTEDDLEEAINDLSNHIHRDMGFGDQLVGDGGTHTRNTIKKYIDGLREDIYKHLGLTDPSNTDAKKYEDAANINLSYTTKWNNPGSTTVHHSLKNYFNACCEDVSYAITQIYQKALDSWDKLFLPKPAGTVLAAPKDQAGVPEFRRLTDEDMPESVRHVTLFTTPSNRPYGVTGEDPATALPGTQSGFIDLQQPLADANGNPLYDFIRIYYSTTTEYDSGSVDIYKPHAKNPGDPSLGGKTVTLMSGTVNADYDNDNCGVYMKQERLIIYPRHAGNNNKGRITPFGYGATTVFNYGPPLPGSQTFSGAPFKDSQIGIEYGFLIYRVEGWKEA